MKIVITDAGTVTNGDLDLSVLSKFGELVTYEVSAECEVAKRIADADIVLCNKTPITKEAIESAPHLKYIGLFATGFNNIDTIAAKGRGVAVCNAGQYSSMSVAQHTFAMILNRASRVADFANHVENGGWINGKFRAIFAYPTSELYQKTLGIVGYGAIGHAVADIARAFGMKVLVFTRTPKEEEGITHTDLDTLLASSDYVSVHLPLNDASRNMFDLSAFEKFKKGAYFVNTSRGGVVVEDDLITALDKGYISGCALDVIVTEPMEDNCKLLHDPRITITPHTAWTPFETRIRLLETVVKNIECYLAGRPQNLVNG